MKRFFLSVLVYLAFQTFGFSQKFYVKASAGHYWPSGSENITSNKSTVKINTERHVTEEVIKGSFGAGINGSLAFGGFFHKYFGVEGGFSYTKGGNFTSAETDVNANRVTRSFSTYSRIPAFQTALLIQGGQNKFMPYGKVGIILAKPQVYFQETDATNELNVYYSKTVSYRGAALGFQGGLGIQYALRNKFGLFTEGSFISMSYAPQEQKYLKYEINGVDKYSSIPKFQRKITYHEKVTRYYRENGSQRFDTNSDSREGSKFWLPFGSFGLQAGIKYNLF